MHTQYTIKELAEFSAFCKQHGMRFNTTREYISAMDQYFIEK